MSLTLFKILYRMFFYVIFRGLPMSYEMMSKDQLIKLIKRKDIEIEKLSKELEKHVFFSTTDCLTGVYNKRTGFKKLKEYMRKTIKNDSNLSICFLDVDDLKVVNDVFGHIEGDKLLKTIGGLIRLHIREIDIIFRMGGDEFIIVFPDANLKEAKIIWEKVLFEFDKLNNTNRFEYKISFSYGFTEYNNIMKTSLKNLIESADKEMYKNKKLKTCNSCSSLNI